MTRLPSLLTSIILIAGLAQANPAQWRSEWPQTNFARTSIGDWSEIVSGGLPKDGSRQSTRRNSCGPNRTVGSARASR